MGSLAFEKPAEGQIISGVLVKRNFKYQIVAPSDISSKVNCCKVVYFYSMFPICFLEYTDMTLSSVTQRMGIHYSGNLQTLQAVLAHVSPDLERIDNDKGLKVFRLFSAIDAIVDKSLVTLEVMKSDTQKRFCEIDLLKCIYFF